MKKVLSFASRIGLILLSFYLMIFTIAFISVPEQFRQLFDDTDTYSAQIVIFLTTISIGIMLGIWFLTGLAEKMVGKKAGLVIGAGVLTAIFLQIFLQVAFNNGVVRETNIFSYLAATLGLGGMIAFCYGCFMMALDPRRLTFEKKTQ